MIKGIDLESSLQVPDLVADRRSDGNDHSGGEHGVGLEQDEGKDDGHFNGGVWCRYVVGDLNRVGKRCTEEQSRLECRDDRDPGVAISTNVLEAFDVSEEQKGQ